MKTESMSRAYRVAAAGLAGSAAVVMAGAATPAAAAGSGTSAVAIQLAPAHTVPGNAASHSYFVRDLRAGGSYRDSVLVSNVGATSVTLTVAAVSAGTAATTGVVYGDRGGAGDASWVKPSVTSVTVPAHATVPVAFTVAVPTGAAAGNHLAGIAFTDPNAVTATKGQLSVRTVYRNVMGVQTNVSGPASARFSLPSASLTAASGTGLATLTLRIANVGALLDHGHLTLDLSRGTYHKSVARNLNVILARDTIDLATLWPTNLAAGSYSLTATLQGSDFPTATLRTAVNLSQAAPGGPTAPIRAFLTPSPAAHTGNNIALVVGVTTAALLILVGSVGWFLVLRLRRRRRDDEAHADSADAFADAQREIVPV